MARSARRFATLLVVAGLIAGALPPSRGASIPAALVAAVAPTTRQLGGPTSFDPLVFDDFNRTVASGWGTSSSGEPWTDNSLRENGVTSADAGNTISVDGNRGRIDYGGSEPIFMLASGGPWREPEWQMRASFRVSYVPSGTNEFNTVYFWVFKDSPDPYADAALLQVNVGDDAVAPGIAGIQLQGTVGDPNVSTGLKTDWQPNTDYCVDWQYIWGSRASANVWPCSESEPAGWMATRDASSDTFQSGTNTVLQLVAFPKIAGATTWFDDVAFSDPGRLPVEPAPADKEAGENGGSLGDPVDGFSGAFSYSHTDIAIAGLGPTPTFTRSYTSNDPRTGRQGPGWNDSYSVRLRDPGDGSGDVFLVRSTGNTDRFTANADGTFSPPPAVYSSLSHEADGSYLLTEKDGTGMTFTADGDLGTVFDRYGNTSTLTYDASGQLTEISDPAGRGSLTLAYTDGLLSSVTDWASPARSVSYEYDTFGRLWKVTDREGKTTTFGYDGTSSRISSITDAKGHVALTLTYDAQGRVATQKDAKGLTSGDETTFAYTVNGDGTRETTVTAPATSYEPSFEPTITDRYDANGWLTQRVSEPSSTETLTESYTYDATGNRTSVTDPRGNETDFCYDVAHDGSTISGSRGNLTRRIDAPPTSGADRPVTLISYDGHDNVTETVAPKGVPSGTTVTCSTDLSVIDTQYATDLDYDAAGVELLAVTSRYTNPDSGAKTAITKYEYGDAANPGRVTRVIPPRGNTTASPDYSYATTLTYYSTGSRAGMLESVADALGDTTTYDYDAVGRLTSSVDPNGNAGGANAADHTTNYVYDKEDRVRFVKLPATEAGGSQLVTETRYDEVGNSVTRIDANGQVTTYTYDDRDALFQVRESPDAWTDPASPPSNVITTEYAYDAAGNLSRMTRAKGDAANERVTDYAFDGRGLVRTETQHPAWPTATPTLVTETTYDANGNVATVTDPLDQTTTNGYDTLNRLTSIDYSDAGTHDIAYHYDANGNRTQMTDGTGTTAYVYDEANRLTSVTSPGPKTVGYRYDRDGNRTKLIYPDSTAVTYTFNKASQLGSLSDWASRTTSYTYNPDGTLHTATNIDSTVASYTYDNASRLTSIVDKLGSTVFDQHTYTLDPLGNVLGLQESVAGLTQGSSAWQPFQRVNDDQTQEPQILPALAMTDDGTAIAAWTDERSGSTWGDIYASKRDPATGQWGANERVNDDGTTAYKTFVSIAVDSLGNAYAAWTDERNGRRDIYFAKRSAASGTWSANVRVNTVTNFQDQQHPDIAVTAGGDAIVAWYRKDAQGKVSIQAARLPAGSSTWSAEMTVTDRKAQPDYPRLAVGSDGTAYATWQDARNHGDYDIYFATVPAGSSTWSSNAKVSDDTTGQRQDFPDIGVDDAGNVTVIWRHWRTFPDPDQVRVSRLAAGSSTWSASMVLASDGGNSPSLAVAPDGRAIAAWHDGLNSPTPDVWESEYDVSAGSWSSPAQVTSSPGGDPAVGLGANTELVVYDASPNPGDDDIRSQIRQLSGGAGSDVITFDYDHLYRLVGSSGPDGSPAYAYDPVGNRTSKVLSGTTTYAYDRADRITAAGSTAVSVDANGNTTAKGTDAFAYDQANRLTSATVDGTTETYTYDGDGLRFSRTVGTDPAIRYVSDVNRSLPVTIDDGTRKYVYGLGLAYAVSGSDVEVYHADRLGSVRSITDGRGAVTATYRYDDWGNLTAQTGSSGQPFGFTGEPADATGLTYLRARYYDPSLGRFTSRDAWGGSTEKPGTMNRYAYAGNSPARYTDPSGRFSWSKALNNCSSDDPCFPELVCFYGICGLTPYSNPLSSYHCDAQCQERSLQGALLVALITTLAYGGVILSSAIIEYFLAHPDALAGPVQGAETLGTFATKGDARSALSSLQLTASQLQSALNAVSRATASTAISISEDGSNVIVNLTRAGRNGYQVIQSVIGPNGTTTVVQYAYDAAGTLVHIDPKFP